MKVESEKVGLKLNIQKTKIMVSSPITSWEIDGETVETVSDFLLGGSKITAYDDYSHDIKRSFLLGRKVLTNLDSILKSRVITLPTNVHLVKVKWSRSVVSDSLRPHRLGPTRLLCPWDFLGNSTEVDCHFLLQGIFPTQGLNLGLPHCRQTLYHKNWCF